MTLKKITMTREEFNRLYEKYLSGKCSEEEQAELENYQDSLKLKLSALFANLSRTYERTNSYT